MSINGDQLDGLQWSYSRGSNMTKTEPPEDYRWHHYETNHGMGNDSTVSPLAKQTLEDYIQNRLDWLDQFELEVTVEGDYRYWRWYTRGSDRLLMWWERRPVDTPLPATPGLWPRSGWEK